MGVGGSRGLVLLLAGDPQPYIIVQLDWGHSVLIEGVEFVKCVCCSGGPKVATSV